MLRFYESIYLIKKELLNSFIFSIVMMISTLSFGQCDFSSFNTNAVNGSCASNGVIEVLIPGASTCSGVTAQLYEVGVPAILASAAVSASGIVNFSSLTPGTYEVFVTNGVLTSGPNQVVLTTTYLPFSYQTLVENPSCNGADQFYLDNGSVEVSLPAGTGLAPFVYTATTSLSTQTSGPIASSSYLFNGFGENVSVDISVQDACGLEVLNTVAIGSTQSNVVNTDQKQWKRICSPTCESGVWLQRIIGLTNAQITAPNALEIMINGVLTPYDSIISNAADDQHAVFIAATSGDIIDMVINDGCNEVLVQDVIPLFTNFVSINDISFQEVNCDITPRFSLGNNVGSLKIINWCEINTLLIEYEVTPGVWIFDQTISDVVIGSQTYDCFNGPGNYRFTLTDACQTRTFTSNLNVPLNASTSPTVYSSSTHEGTGGVLLEANGYSGSVTYSIEPVPSAVSTVFLSNSPGIQGSMSGNYTINWPFETNPIAFQSQYFRDLPPGDYQATISDINGCKSSSELFTISSLTTYLYEDTIIKGCSTSEFVFDFNSLNRNRTVALNISLLDQTTLVNTGLVPTNGLSINGNSFINVPAGSYYLRVGLGKARTPFNGEISVLSANPAPGSASGENKVVLIPIEIESIVPLELYSNPFFCDVVNPNSGIIAGGIVTGTGSSLVDFYLYDDLGNLIDQQLSQTNGSYIFQNLTTGTYLVEANDGCSVNSINVVLTNTPVVYTPIADVYEVCPNSNTVNLSIALNESLYDIEWFNSSNISLGTGNSLQINPLITDDYYVEYTLSASSGCPATVFTSPSISIVVQDNVAPTAVCQDITVQLDATGNVSIVAADIDGGSTDNCGPVTLSASTTAFDCATVGANVVTLTVTDANGNTSTCDATVTVADNVAPTAVCQDITVQLDATGNASIVAADIDGGSTDNCGPVTLSASTTAFDCATVGANVVTLTVTDANGNTSTCDATVTVEDNVAPTAVCQDITVQLDATGNVSIVAADIDGGSTDNCGPVTLSASTTAFDCATVGANVVTLTVTDANGNTSTCDATVTVADNVAPTAVCQDITVQLDATGNVSIVAADIDGGSTDNCGPVTLSASTTAFDCATVGANVVTLTVTDANGNTSTCDATVTVEDNVAPTAVCQDITVQLDATGNVSIVAADIDGGSTDNCGPVTLSASTTAFDCATVGANVVTLTVTDANGNTSTCDATVTVEDNVAPTAVCQDITVQLDATGNASIVAADIDGGSTDNCGPVTLSASTTAFDCATVGANVVTLTVTDANGNTSTCDATVTVADNVAPTAVCQDITVQLDATGNVSIVAADIDGGSTDNCGPVTLSASTTAFDCATVGANVVTLTVTDANGNTSTCDATVTVADNVAPTAVCQDITVQLDATGNASIVAADIDGGSTDNCGPVTLSASTTAFDCATVGANVVTLTVTDANGNTSTCDATVTVADNVAPTAVCQDITVQLDATGNASIVAADIDGGSTDNCGPVTLSASTTAFDCATVGANVVTLTVTDANGNTSTCDATVTVEDNVAPTAVCQDITVQLDATGNASIVAADIDGGSTDNCGPVTLSASTTAFDCATVGANVVTLTVTDANGNTSTCDATVTVADNVAPTAVCQDITVQLDATGNASIVAADIDGGSTDNCGPVTLSASTTAFDCATVGANVVTLTVTDANGNTSTCDATVTVADNVAPTAVCQDITVQLDATGNVSIVAADIDGGSTDNCGPVTLSASTTAFDCATVGANVVTLTVTDANGNTSTCDATVTVADNVAPTAVCQDITVQLDATGNVSIVAADIDGGSTDNCGPVTLSASTTAFDCATVGANVVTLTVTDANGNTSTCDATVTVADNVAPTAVCQDITVQLDATGNVSIVAADIDGGSTDNCGPVTLSASTTAFDCATVGANVVTLTVTDANGNTSTCDATVTVADNVAPTAVCQDITVQLDATGNVSIVAADIDGGSTDNCGPVTLSASTTAFDCATVGANVVTLTVTDANGNTSTCDATVTVADNVAPTAVCQDITVQLDATGNVSIVAADIDGGSTDNCGPVTLSASTTAFDCATVGANVVTLTVTDANGNTSTCDATVTVADNVAPTAVCQDITVQLDATGNVSIVAADIDGGSTDNCGPVTLSASTTAFDCATVGANVVTLTVTDANGNTSTCDATVTVADNVAPTIIDCPSNVQIENAATGCPQDVYWNDPTAVDNCQVSSITSNYLSGDIFNPGVTDVTYTVLDVNGNSSSCTFEVFIIDNSVINPAGDFEGVTQVCIDQEQSIDLNDLIENQQSGGVWSSSDEQWLDVTTGVLLLDSYTEGTYNATYTVDLGVCGFKSVDVILSMEYCIDCIYPELITPNGDGFNDAFVINCFEQFDKISIQIFNRWGSVVYESSDYQNDWDGSSTSQFNIGGNELPEGTYYYLLEKNSEVHKGFIYLKRQ